MNAGIIASRYAKAFLKFVQEDGSGENAYSQACTLVHVMNELPQFREYVKDASDITLDMKVSLLTSAVGTSLDASLARFLKMVTDHRRIEYFPRMLLSFIEQYRNQNNIKVGRLVMPAQDEGFRDRLEYLFQEKTGTEVHLEETLEPELIGGFVFELDGYRLDASVRNHLDRIRRQLVEKNNRIV